LATSSAYVAAELLAADNDAADLEYSEAIDALARIVHEAAAAPMVGAAEPSA